MRATMLWLQRLRQWLWFSAKRVGLLEARVFALLAICLVSCARDGERSTAAAPSAGSTRADVDQESDESRPNILLILADDLGYSDIGAFGGEIATPNIDGLAANGVTLTNFHVHMFCTPTRAMLMTGVGNHVAGIGTMAGEWRGDQKGAPGYEAYLSDRVITVATLLKDSGYHTYISGKWDLGGRNDDSLLPDKRGFERSYVLVEGSADHFRNFPALAELSNVNYREDGRPTEPPENFYSSDLYADKLISQIGQDRDSGKPFFGYLSFTAPHYPLQAPDAYIEKYKGKYDVGYDVIRNRRLERMQAKGLLSDRLEPAEPFSGYPDWDELSPEFRAYEARRMEVYAAMVEAMDANIGKVLNYLKEIGDLDNTLIVFLSDNGAEGGDPLDWAPYYLEWAEKNFDLSFENLGRHGSYAWTGPQWAQVSSAPYRLFKGFPTRGGILSPTIISFPAKMPRGRISNVMATAKDLPATFLDIAGVEHPQSTYAGREIAPIEGVSLAPTLEAGATAIHDETEVFVWEIMDRRAVQKGKWKIVWINKPFGKGVGEWALYDLENDPTERADVSLQHPEIQDLLVEAWDAYVRKNKVITADYSDVTYVNKSSHFEWLPDGAVQNPADLEN